MNFYPTTTAELIDAITQANANGVSNTIFLQPNGVYILTSVNNSSVEGPNGLPIISSDLVIKGNGAIIKRDQFAPSFRILHVVSGGTLSLFSLTVSNGRLDGFHVAGGGILNRGGTLYITQSNILNNYCSNLGFEGYGGGICNLQAGTLKMVNSVVENNIAGGLGGGIYNYNPLTTAEIANCSIYGNKTLHNSHGGGAGIAIFDGAILVVSNNSIISHNILKAGNGGGIGCESGRFTVVDSTLKNNVAPNTGGAVYSKQSSNSIISNCRIFGNNGGNVVNNNDPSILAYRVDASQNWWGSNNGPSGVGPGSGDSVSSGVTYSSWLQTEDPEHSGPNDCTFGYATNGDQNSSNPISLRFGEKRLETTDLSLNTPAGALNFTRVYLQNNQSNPFYQHMGLGWTHNHDMFLEDPDPNNNGDIVLHTALGGKVVFHYNNTVGTVKHYQAATGSNADIKVDTASPAEERYVLTAVDQSIFVFDDQQKLRSRTWPNDETWSYQYYEAPHFAAGKLNAVVDEGYEFSTGQNRKLVFTYEANPEYDDNGTPVAYDHTLLLKRVTDHIGRYVEFDYVPERSNGSIITTPKALMATVQDVREQVWTYDYYGQVNGENDSQQLNFLTARHAPLVDADGDEIPEMAITLERLIYAGNTQIELALNGDMELDTEDWQSIIGAEPTTNERSTVEFYGGNFSQHVVASAANQGIEGNIWNLVQGKHYTITARVFVESGMVKMQVSDTTLFDDTSSTTSAWETLSATVSPFTGSTQISRRLRLIASGGAAEFYVDNVSILETNPDISAITQERGVIGSLIEEAKTFTFVPHQGFTREMTVGDLTQIHRFDRGIYAGAVDSGGNITTQNPGSKFRSTGQIDANGHITGIKWSDNGKSLEGVTDALGNETQFEYDSQGRLKSSTDAQDRITEYTYGSANAPRQPTVIKVYDSDGTTALHWQQYTYDPKGRTTDERLVDPNDGVSILQQTTREYETNPGNGHGLLKKVTQVDQGSSNSRYTEYTYDEVGRVTLTKQGSNFGDCCATATAYDAAGNVIETINAPDITQISDPYQSPVTRHSYDALGRRVSTTVHADTTHARTSLTFYDALSRVERTISSYLNPEISTGVYEYTAPGTWSWDANQQVWVDQSSPTPKVISHGADNTANAISEMDYNERGMVRLQRDVLGKVTLLGYYAAGRVVKTIQSASQPAYDNTYGVTGDPDLSAYVGSSDPDQDIITLNDYDPVGNLVKTTDPLGQVSFTVYDALNRPVKTVRNAHENATASLNPEDSSYDVAHDPRTAEYAISTDPDQDQVSTAEYDALGRVVRTRQLLENRTTYGEIWDTTLYGYDALGRRIKSIRSASQPSYDVATDPGLSAYVASSAADLDIVSTTVYEDQGRVLYSEDVLGNRTWMAYDGLGRPIKTIINAVGTATDDGTSDPRSSSYVPDNSVTADKDLISHTVYDDDGRVLETMDMLGRVTRQVYDDLGRQVRTVSNYVDNSYNDPADWVWESGEWKDAPAGAVISPGVHYDQNIISTTEYDDQGRVWKTFDPRYNENRMVYDTLGRRVMTIANYVTQGNSAPENWLWDAGDGRWEDGAGNAIDHGSANDLNQISTTTYDIAGRVTANRDHAGLETRYEYDALGRRVKTIHNYVDGVYTPATPDEDLVSETQYNKAGQVLVTIDPRGTQTQFEYDQMGRRIRVIQAADTLLETVSHTCYDKAGRQLRVIQNYLPLLDENDVPISPDDRSNGQWAFQPEEHGPNNDQNLITTYQRDRLGRVIRTTDPLGHTTLTRYDRAGRVQWVSDPEYTRSQYLYDKLGRRVRVIQGYLPVQHQPQILYQGEYVDYNVSRFVHNIFFMDADPLTNDGFDPAKEITQTPDLHEYDPCWSPDGTQIVFYGRPYDQTGVTEIYVMNADGTNVRQITDLNSLAENPVWSPDGGRIAFTVGTVYQDPEAKLYVVNADGSDLHILYQEANWAAISPTWSPDGGRIAFRRLGQGVSDIYTIQVDGVQLENLTAQTALRCYEPAWSPDGRRIAFSAQVVAGGRFNLYLQDVDGQNLIQLTDNPDDNAFQPAWSPDGQHLVYFLQGDTTDGELLLYILNLVDSSTVALTQVSLDPNGRASLSPDWLPTVDAPQSWSWNETNSRWEDSTEAPLDHGSNSDQNIIVDVTYDKAGRMLSLRNPRGHVTTYTYDDLNRRLTLSNPLSQSWETAYSDLTAGGTRVQQTYPGLSSGGSYIVERDFDRLGRLSSINYHSPTTTPSVRFGYDVAGNRVQMTEYDGTGFTNRIRELFYDYDAARRLVTVQADGDGNGIIDAVVDYEYDAGGLRTKLTLPGNLAVTYTYDAKGQLVSLTDWDSQATTFTHDAVGRLLTQERPNGLDSSYTYDPAGRLRLLRHVESTTVYGEFAYEVDGRGNRTQAHEMVLHPGEMDSDEYTVQYSYDALSRLTHADFYVGTDLNVSPEGAYTYSYDQTGNRLSEALALNGGTPTVTSYSYNAANQLTSDGSNTFGYDANGNLITVNSFPIATWDRANRMLSGSDGTTNVQYTYTGTGERIRKVAGSTTYNYLMDLQSPLPVVLAEYVGSTSRQFVHGPRGVYAQEDASGNWTWPIHDGLGSMRLVSDDSPAVAGIQHYIPFGIPFGTQGSLGLPYGFTGEQTDENGLVYLRARYLSPALGMFTSLDPFEGMAQRPMSLNGYNWVEGNVVNGIDPSGMCSTELPCGNTLLALTKIPSPPMGAEIDDSYLDERTISDYLKRMIGEAYGVFAIEAELVRAGALRARSQGYDDAARNIIHFLDNTGNPISDYPVDKMLTELPMFDFLVKKALGGNVWQIINNFGPNSGQDLSIPLSNISPSCRLWTNGVGFTRIGKDSVVRSYDGDPYPNISNTVSYQELANLDASNPNLNEIDWFLAMNSFAFSIGYSLIVDDHSGEAVLCYKVRVEDYYAWYHNEGTGSSDLMMGNFDSLGLGQHYSISGESDATCIYFNLNSSEIWIPENALHPHYLFE